MSSVIVDGQAARAATSQKVALTVAAAKSTNLYNRTNLLAGPESVDILFTPDVNCFMRAGPVATVTCLSDGTDQYYLANNMYRINGILPGDALAIILASGTGNAYITPLTI